MVCVAPSWCKAQKAGGVQALSCVEQRTDGVVFWWCCSWRRGLVM